MNTVKVLKTVADIREFRARLFLEGKRVGLVPTMGAIHQGHLELLSTALQTCDAVVVTIFVNPSQFAPHEDLARYPRSFEADLLQISKFASNKSVVVFAPETAEMYPSRIPLVVEEQKGAFVQVLGVSEQLEGSSRPHFFRGVATVVTKLLNLILPNSAYFGQKDIQQCIVIKRLVKDLLFNTEIVIVGTVRCPEDGLALSSRNVYLSKDQRQKAPAVYRGLSKAQTFYTANVESQPTRASITKFIYDEIDLAGSEYFTIDYICLSDKSTLAELDCVGPDGAILSVAWKMGSTRLIDNLILGSSL
ncbi:hypothetical protein BB561_005848 [Smittium simulii]|uniref:Pantoate--beta-alanine ligase n=1 Tax=Smittium simulii TaxID=133385 RepID=A0A2T9Y7Y4_9FUNG|nr:hypothetical protein BB561_005848 [Smittium simulii]